MYTCTVLLCAPVQCIEPRCRDATKVVARSAVQHMCIVQGTITRYSFIADTFVQQLFLTGTVSRNEGIL